MREPPRWAGFPIGRTCLWQDAIRRSRVTAPRTNRGLRGRSFGRPNKKPRKMRHRDSKNHPITDAALQSLTNTTFRENKGRTKLWHARANDNTTIITNLGIHQKPRRNHKPKKPWGWGGWNNPLHNDGETKVIPSVTTHGCWVLAPLQGGLGGVARGFPLPFDCLIVRWLSRLQLMVVGCLPHCKGVCKGGTHPIILHSSLNHLRSGCVPLGSLHVLQGGSWGRCIPSLDYH